MSIFSSVCAQVPTESKEINPKYLEWKKSGKEQYILNGHALGELPLPYKIHVELPPGLKFQIDQREFAAPTYDLRNTGGVTSVKDQGYCGSCWTFATMASIESRWLIDGRGYFDLSEDNLNTCHIPFLWEPCAGGNAYLSAAYLVRGSGPIAESDDPYSDGNTTVDCPVGLVPQGFITSAWFLPTTDPELIKNHIVQYGALATNMYWDASSYNSSNFTYYYSGTSGTTNHAVTLVGWDDNKVTAGGTGAWIIKNSWGPAWGENGYFYIAYQDVEVNSTLALFPHYADYHLNDKVTTYSESGWVGSSVGLGSNSADALVKFVTDNPLQLNRIGTYTAYPGTVVSIEIYDDFDGSASLTGFLGSIPAQTCLFTGYYSFDLPVPLNISEGNDYYVKINYQTPDYNYPIPFEEVISGFSNPVISTGEFWAKKYNRIWLDLIGLL